MRSRSCPLDYTEDAGLVEEAKKGSDDAFDTLYRRHCNRLFNYAFNLTGGPVVSEVEVYCNGKGGIRRRYLSGPAKGTTYCNSVVNSGNVCHPVNGLP